LKKQLLPVLFWLLPACTLFAQQDKVAFDYNFIHYDIEDGLPSNETYVFKEDQEGYLWIGTDKGVARFNGYEFKNYTTNDGLTDNTMLRMALGPDGKLWMTGYNNSLCYADKGKVYPFEGNENLQKLTNRVFGSAEIEIDKNYNIFYRALRGAFIISRDGTLKQFFPVRYENTPEEHRFVWFNGALKSYCSAPGATPGIHPVRIYLSDTTYYQTRLPFKTISSYFLHFQGKKYLYAHGTLFIIDKDQTVVEKKFETQGIGMLTPIGEEIWVCSMKGILVLDGEGNIKNTLLEGEQISSVYQDKNNNIWISTLNNGIYQIKNKAIKVLKKNNVPVKYRFPILYTRGEAITAVNYSDETACSAMKVPSVNLEIFNQQCNPNYLAQFNLPNSIKNRQFTFEQYLPWINTESKAKAIHQYKDNLYAVSHVTLFRKALRDKPGEWQFLAYMHGNKVMNTLYVLDENHVLLGGRDGLYEARNGQITQHPASDSIKSRVQDIELLNTDTILATRGNGLKVLGKNGIRSLTEKEGLLRNNINNLFRYENQVWVATDGGVNLLFAKGDSLVLEKKITQADGLSSIQIRQLLLLDGMAYLGAEKGLCQVNLSLLTANQTTQIPVYFTNIRINDTDTNVLKRYDLAYDQNLIRIDYEALDFKQSGQILYKYRMNELSDRWDYTQSRSALYTNLSPGKYVFEVAAQFANGDWTRPVQIEFFISKPYWATWWFRIGAAFFLFGSAYLLYTSSSAARRKREQLAKELNTSRQMALGSQINPHFIFNSLNAIYNFLLKNKDEIAQSYLVRFSRLIRNVFENSMERYIPISQELETLKLYLELEQLRFSNKFSYNIHIAEDIRQDSTYIPPMLLQPLVENAIWHGLLNKEDHELPLLQIQVEKEGDKLRFAISDNGVGLSQAREKQKNQILRKGKSTGLTITKKRVSLVNEYYNKEFYFSVEENNADPRIKGTTVAFSLPHINSKPE